jgi:hypothetical protein
MKTTGDQCTPSFSYLPWAAAFLIAALPRLIRLIYPYAWFEDAAYIYHGFALQAGLRPFQDILFVHPPAFEGLLSLLYRVFGTTYRVPEILSALVMTGTALLVFDSVRRLLSAGSALFASAVFSGSALLARYHIYEREVYTAGLAVLVIWLLVSRRERPGLYVGIGILCGIGFAIKFSGIFIPAAVIIYLLADKKRPAALTVAAGFIAVGGGVWAYYFIKYGSPAFYQLILFHFVKGVNVPLLTRLRETFVLDLNYVLPLGAAGVILTAGRRPHRALLLPFILFAEFTIYFLFFSSTLWAHNMIDLLFPLAVGAGYAFWRVKGMIVERRWPPGPVLLIAGLFGIFTILGSFDLKHNYQGWGYLSRRQVAEVAALIRANTPENMPVYAPQYLANEARRLRIVDYEELLGPYRWMLETLKSEGIRGLSKSRAFGTWLEAVGKTAYLWRPDVDKALVEGSVSVAVWDSDFPEWNINYEIDVIREQRSGLMSRSGYVVVYDRDPYKVWFNPFCLDN